MSDPPFNDGQRTAAERSPHGIDVGMLRRVLNDCIQRRAAGELLPDEDVIRTHPHLMPELARELRLLAVMRRAADRAGDAVGDSAGGGTLPASASVTAGSSVVGALPDAPLERPDAIPGYRLLREVYRGGQGTVFVAHQESTRRDVAIKLVRPGPCEGGGDATRFQREVELLVRLRHPNIVAIHDTGIAGGARFIVMDLIDGMPLDEYATSRWRDGADDDIREILALFAKVCEAVHAAHLRGVIHRDLKPRNILVDAQGEPHVLDFGLAKDIAPGSEVTLTSDGQFVGSVPWASPEQVGGSSDIDVRTDVYSLGVVLFQLLTGKFPYTVSGPIAEVFAAITGAAPIPPAQLRPSINDEVQTIVLKCLNKEAERRYQSAGELARDLRRYLAGEPIEAKRDSTLYLLGKRLRRYRRAAAAGATMVALLALGIAGTTYGLWQAETRRVEAEKARTAEFEQRTLADKRRAEAEYQARIATAVTRFMTLDVLGADTPMRPLAERDERISDVLARAEKRIESGSLSDQPGVEASVRSLVGSIYLILGRIEDGERHARRALELKREIGGDDSDIAICLSNLGMALLSAGRLSDADGLLREALKLVRGGSVDAEDVRAMVLNNHADLLRATGRIEDAGPLYDEALAELDRLGTSATKYLELRGAVLCNKGELERLRGNLAAAVELADQSLEALRRALGDEHIRLATALNNKGLAVKSQGDLATAETLQRQALEMRRRVLPAGHTEIAQSLNNLASLLFERGEYADAENMYRETLEVAQQSLPPGHFQLALIRRNLGNSLFRLKRFEEAEPELLAAYAQLSNTRGLSPALVQKTGEALVVLYDAWARAAPGSEAAAKAAHWRARLAPASQPVTTQSGTAD